MRSESFMFKGKYEINIFVYKWVPNENIELKGIVQIAHGMAETAIRYEKFAEVLTDNGFIVYANDHRGHGKTAGKIEKVGDLGEDSFNSMVDDMHELNKIIKNENVRLPIFLLGHSMGSFLTQKYISLYGNELNGVMLTGTCGKKGIITDIGRLIAKCDSKRIGRNGKSILLNKLIIGRNNNFFNPSRTAFDWLSRDNKEVDKYIDDPYCGTIFTAGFFYDLLSGIKEIASEIEIKSVPKDLPIYIFAGDKDPVGENGRGVIKLVKTYNKHGVKDLIYKLYKDGRHEMLHETNTEEVFYDVIQWLKAHR
ncbi:alpha/beta hydrolase [Clostridium psychrophilum]|uniref:alpha/beta hydrolase n=1 Tax=Clostridium psychrophilum TaxID=132926 RepID=UPI001C0CD288|nr:alpha/beta hydrolase [Clostridium psychrophilum]MBU3182998.1 lysophospholipase [Clostridium psychrophilum]